MSLACVVDGQNGALELFGESALPRLSHGICGPCGESLRRSASRPA